MTQRQLEVLRMVRDVVQAGGNWIELALTSGSTAKITWEEMKFVSEFENQAMLTRIEAAMLVADAVDRTQSEEPTPAAVCSPRTGCVRD